MAQCPVLIMIHGGGHTHPKYFETLQNLLQAEGFSTVAGASPSDGATDFIRASLSTTTLHIGER